MIPLIVSSLVNEAAELTAKNGNPSAKTASDEDIAMESVDFLPRILPEPYLISYCSPVRA